VNLEELAMTITPVTPVPPAERVELLDALRGFALLGILFINLNAFSAWRDIGTENQAALVSAGLDGTANFLFMMLVENKFYSLFSLLFGIGFAIQMLRAAEKGIDFAPRFRRRLWVLLGIGMIHLCLFWSGDILVLYALLGFALIPMIRFGDRQLLVAGAALILAPIAVRTAFLLSGGGLDPGPTLYALAERVDESLGFPLADYPWFMAEVGWVTFFKSNAAGPIWRLGGLLQDSRALKVFGMFLIGFVAARRMNLRNVNEHRALLTRVLVWGLALGLTMNLVWAWMRIGVRPAFLSWSGVAHSVAFAIGVAPLALAYAAGFALLWDRGWWKRLLGSLAPAGRMALTNYLMQTAFGIGIFYGVGLGLVGRVGPALILPLALLIFMAQVQLSAVWLRRFRYGPAEWVWRSLTHGRREPLRLRTVMPSAATTIAPTTVHRLP
jgi:uncharacterized protein